MTQFDTAAVRGMLENNGTADAALPRDHARAFLSLACDEIDRLRGVLQMLAMDADIPPDGGFDAEPPSWATAPDWHMYGDKCGYCGCWCSVVRPGKIQCDWCSDGRDKAVIARAALSTTNGEGK